MSNKDLKTSGIFLKISYMYILLPFLIFTIGWLKVYIAIPVAIILLFCYLKMWKEAPQIWLPELNWDNFIKIGVIIGIIAIWVYLSGIGKFVFQNPDHSTRNTIFNILVEYKWPVLNHEILVDKMGDVSVTRLVYYVGFWLPSAVIGKIFGLRVGYYAQALWALVGIVLVYYFICMIHKKLVLWPLWIVIFFSGLDIIGQYLIGTDLFTMSSSLHLEWWANPYQYSSMTTQLFWAFNQAIPAWLCTILLYIQKDNRSMIFILATSFITSTFSFVGLIPISIFLIFSKKENIIMGETKNRNVSKKIKYGLASIRSAFTIQNVVGGGIIGIISFLYLISNASANRVMGIDPRGPEWNNSLIKYIIFLLFDVVVFAVLLYKYNKKNKLYYFILICLFIFPPIKIGYSNDFCMRASIPALFILMLLVIETLKISWEKRDYKIFTGLIIALAIGSITPIHELTRTISTTVERIKEDEVVYAEDKDPKFPLNSPNFVATSEDSFFFKYLAK